MMKNLFKRIGQFFLEPLKLSGNRNISERLSRFFNANGAVLYIVALFVTAAIFACVYLF